MGCRDIAPTKQLAIGTLRRLNNDLAEYTVGPKNRICFFSLRSFIEYMIVKRNNISEVKIDGSHIK